jgi:hypothetical protein
MGRLAALTAVLLLVGTPVAQASDTPVSGREWLAVINDWLDDKRLEGPHSCGAVVEAIVHFQSASWPHGFALNEIRRYGRQACPRASHLDRIAVGMSDRAVAAVAGMPSTVHPRCWLYAVTRGQEGRRVCFANGRVSRIWHVHHL